MSALPHDAPAPRIQCARCYRYLPTSAFRVRTFNKALKRGGVSHKTYRMRRCITCERELDILRRLPAGERQQGVEIGAIVTRLVPLAEGGFSAYDHAGNWLADGESAIAIISELYRNARKTNAAERQNTR